MQGWTVLIYLWFINLDSWPLGGASDPVKKGRTRRDENINYTLNQCITSDSHQYSSCVYLFIIIGRFKVKRWYSSCDFMWTSIALISLFLPPLLSFPLTTAFQNDHPRPPPHPHPTPSSKVLEKEVCPHFVNILWTLWKINGLKGWRGRVRGSDAKRDKCRVQERRGVLNLELEQGDEEEAV